MGSMLIISNMTAGIPESSDPAQEACKRKLLPSEARLLGSSEQAYLPGPCKLHSAVLVVAGYGK